MPLLSELIALPALPLISLVGAGGKTTTMYTFASELAQKHERVITTTTTNIYFPRPGETDTLIVAAETPVLIKMVLAAWKQHQRVTVAGKMIGAGKIGALEPGQPYELLTKSGASVVIVEADGSVWKERLLDPGRLKFIIPDVFLRQVFWGPAPFCLWYIGVIGVRSDLADEAVACDQGIEHPERIFWADCASRHGYLAGGPRPSALPPDPQGQRS